MSKARSGREQLKSKISPAKIDAEIRLAKRGPGGARPGAGRKKVKYKKVPHTFKLAAVTTLELKRFAKARRSNLTVALEKMIAEYVVILNRGNTVNTWGGEQLTLDGASIVGE